MAYVINCWTSQNVEDVEAYQEIKPNLKIYSIQELLQVHSQDYYVSETSIFIYYDKIYFTQVKNFTVKVRPSSFVPVYT